VASYMPITITTRERSLILGGPDDEPELYDLADDPGEQHNLWTKLSAEGEILCGCALFFLEQVGAPEEYLTPRGKTLAGWRKVVKS
jgi:hypothetical protein